jgi:hypothetical protein
MFGKRPPPTCVDGVLAHMHVFARVVRRSLWLMLPSGDQKKGGRAVVMGGRRAHKQAGVSEVTGGREQKQHLPRCQRTSFPSE